MEPRIHAPKPSRFGWYTAKVVRLDSDPVTHEPMALVEVRVRRWHPGYWFNRLLWAIGFHRIVEGEVELPR